MNIPDYDSTLCKYCKKYNECNHKKFKIKLSNKNQISELKYSYCKDYDFIGGNNDIKRRENF